RCDSNRTLRDATTRQRAESAGRAAEVENLSPSDVVDVAEAPRRCPPGRSDGAEGRRHGPRPLWRPAAGLHHACVHRIMVPVEYLVPPRPPSPIPSSSGDPYGPSYLQIGSLGQCLSIGCAAGAQNVEHPRGDHGAAGNCHACPEGGSMKLQARVGAMNRRTGQLCHVWRHENVPKISVHIQDVSATGHGHSAGRKRFESKTRRREPKRIPEPMANALSSRGPRGRERSDNSGDSLR
ncbi:hypothetical protein THAOC_26485, partial [Thalassiosira oceanica]